MHTAEAISVSLASNLNEGAKTKLKCSGGFHDQWRNIFGQLDEYDIHVYSDIGHYPYFIVFDFKAIRHAIDETQLGTL